MFLVAQLVLVVNGWTADSLFWRTNSALVSADIRDAKLSWLLEEITTTTGWSVFVEPDVSHLVSAKFKDLPPGEALRLLLGDLNFALIPEAKAPPKLFVFRTMMGSATQQVRLPAAVRREALNPIPQAALGVATVQNVRKDLRGPLAQAKVLRRFWR